MAKEKFKPIEYTQIEELVLLDKIKIFKWLREILYPNKRMYIKARNGRFVEIMKL